MAEPREAFAETQEAGYPPPADSEEERAIESALLEEIGYSQAGFAATGLDSARLLRAVRDAFADLRTLVEQEDR